MINLNITIRNTHFVVSGVTIHHRKLIDTFNTFLTTTDSVYLKHQRRVIVTGERRYYYNIDNHTYHYSIHLLKTFIGRAIKYGMTKDDFIIHNETDVSYGELKATIREEYKDRDHQLAYIEKAIETNPMVLIDLNTGKGKTYISMRVATELKMPTAIIVLPRYIDKWIGDVKKNTTVKDEDIYVVRGKDSLTRLLEDDKQYDFVIFSLNTLRNYITAIDNGELDTDIRAEDILSKLGLGMVINDEVHQNFHAVYMTTIRLNPAKVVALSATLDNLNTKVSQMYNTLYPSDYRCGNLVKFDPYAIVVAVSYNLDNPKAVNCTGYKGYSHVMFEQYLMRRSMFRNMYIDMILHYTKIGYVDRRTKGSKCLILVQTVALATLLTNYLNHKLNGVVVKRYVEEDPYDNIMDADITVSTNQSAGAALDIPQLITVIQTVSMRSLQGNVQALGRLREIKGTDVMYYYTYARNLPKQYDLHVDRKDVIGHLTKEYRYVEYDKELKVK